MSDTRTARFQAEAARLGYDFGGKLQVGGNYVPTLKHQGVLHVSGQVPRVGSEVVVVGDAGGSVTLERAQHAAEVCAMRALVGNAASDLLVRVLGPAGAHTRTSVGVAQLPKGAAVEVEVTAAVA